MTLTRQQSRDVDKIAIERYGFSGLVLMENAGRGVVDVLLELDPALEDSAARSVLILCGKGNNGGDGFVIARHLEMRGVPVQVVLLAPPTELQGDALVNYNILRHTDVPITEQILPGEPASVGGWLIDALLGTGAQGEPREPYATAIDWMNSQPARKLAIDIPSGLDCDTGQPSRHTVRADHTCTFVAAKVGFEKTPASDFLGSVHVVGIGIPPRVLRELDNPA